MEIVKQKILLLAGEKETAAVSSAVRHFSGLEVLKAPNENKAFEMIFRHRLVLVIIDQERTDPDPEKTGTMLLSHQKAHNIPMLILTGTQDNNFFLDRFQSLTVDCLAKPLDPVQLAAKLNLFMELAGQKTAVRQSITELDRIYQNILAQNELSLSPEDMARERKPGHTPAAAADKILTELQNLQGHLYRMSAKNRILQAIKPDLTAMKTSAEQIALAAQKFSSLSTTPRAPSLKKDLSILYIQPSAEEFNIFAHILKRAVPCKLLQTPSIEKSLETISLQHIDLIFTDFLLTDGTGFDLLSRLNHVHADTPVIFTMDRSCVDKGPKAISKGALGFISKENLSAPRILTLIHRTLKKSSFVRQAEEARDRITMISRRDLLTRLFNRKCFEQELELEVTRAKRYQTDLSVLLLDITSHKQIKRKQGISSADTVLTACAMILQNMIRKNDLACRYGESEFALILPGTPPAGAGILAKRLRNHIRKNISGAGKNAVFMSTAMGIAAYDHALEISSPVLVRNALNALAAAIENGCDAIETHHEKKDTP